MRFIPYHSGSAGNSYEVRTEEAAFLLECGLPFKELQKKTGFRLADMAGCLITHEHQDHAKAAPDLLRYGIDLYMTEGTRQALGLSGAGVHVIRAKEPFSIGDCKVLAFEAEHDAAEPVGFLIQDKEDRLLFATDTFYIRYTFPGLTIIAVECNYSDSDLEQSILDGNTPVILNQRLRQSHFSLQNYKNFLQANDLSRVREIWMLHLSDNNSDEAGFKDEIQALTGKPVFIA